MSIIKIARQLTVSKSVVSLWCRDIFLTEQQKQALIDGAFDARMRGRLIGVEVNRQKRVDAVHEAKKWARSFLGRLNKRDFLITGIALYWAEGSKTDRRFIFVNSNPVMILVMFAWLKSFFNLRCEDFLPRISINEIHRPRIRKVLAFWSDLLQLPVEQFGNPWYIKAKVSKIYDNYEIYNGILRLGIKNAAPFKYKMLAMMELLSEIAKRDLSR